jgi:hypothetical protein
VPEGLVNLLLAGLQGNTSVHHLNLALNSRWDVDLLWKGNSLTHLDISGLCIDDTAMLERLCQAMEHVPLVKKLIFMYANVNIDGLEKLLVALLHLTDLRLLDLSSLGELTALRENKHAVDLLVRYGKAMGRLQELRLLHCEAWLSDGLKAKLDGRLDAAVIS